MALKALCPSCRADLQLAPGERLPPWCPKCGESVSPEAVEEVEMKASETGDVQPSAGSRQPAPQANAICANCNSNLNLAPGEPMPPWCRTCGVNLKEQPPAAANSESPQPAAPAVAYASIDEPLESIRFEPSPLENPDLLQIQTERLHREFRERFARHNVIAGIVLGIWSVWAISAHDIRTADVRVLESEHQLNATIEVLQIATFLTGSVLLISGYGIARRESWGYLLAGLCAAAAITGGMIFLGGLMHLRGKADDLASSVALITYVRWNLDLLFGLVDGGALLVFLYRHSQLPPDPLDEQSAFDNDRDVWPEWS